MDLYCLPQYLATELTNLCARKTKVAQRLSNGHHSSFRLAIVLILFKLLYNTYIPICSGYAEKTQAKAQKFGQK